MTHPKRPIHNFSLKVIAVLFAIFLWFYVDAQQNPMAEQRFEVPVHYINLTDDLSYTGGSDTVTVTVKCRQDRLNTLRSSDLIATVDMNAVSTGANQLNVHIAAPNDVEIASIRPNRMKLTVERQSAIELAIQAKVIGTAAQGYNSFTPSLEPATVTVQGAESLLSQLATAQVEIDITNAAENVLRQLPIRLLTADGESIDTSHLQLSAEMVEAFLPIDQDMPSKTVAIKPQLIGQVATGYEISRVTVVPETAKIVGKYNDIRAIDQLESRPIDTNGLTDDLVQEVSLIVPEAITLLSEDTVKVVVFVSPIAETKTIALPLVIQGETPYEVTLSQLTVRLTLSGTEDELDDPEKRETLTPIVDVSDLTIGTHSVEVKLQEGAQLQVTQIYPETIDVTLSEPIETDETEIP